MEKTEWYIREYKCANGVCVKTKFPATRDDGIRIGSRRYQRELRRAEKNATEAKHEAARSLNNNFLAGVDKYLGMDYDDKAMARLCRRIGIPEEDIPAFLHAALEEKNEAARMALYLSADKEFENFIDRARRACAAAGVEFRYFWVTSDLDGHSLQPVRVHHHMVANKEAAEICAAKWNAGETWDKKLYGAHHGDLTELAEYMISQVRSIPGKKRYHPSRTLKKPKPTKPIKARNPAAELRVPKGCELIWRSENYAGRPQQLRYYRPSGSGTRGGEDDEDEGD